MIKALVLSLFVACPAAAGEFKTVRFYLPDNVPQRPADFENALAASVGIGRLNVDRFCSGVALSNSGYVLTNLHCVLECLNDKDWRGRGLIKEEAGDGYNIVRVAEDARVSGVVCEDYTLEDYLEGGASHRLIGARVVLLSRAKSNFSEEKVLGLPADVVESLRESMDDYALLKFEPASPLACATLAEQDPRPGDPLWGIGYPTFTTRYDGYDSTGYKEQVSFGEIRAGIRLDPYLQGRIKDEDAWRRLDRIYSAPGLILSSLDVVSGNSGGPLYDRSGRLVGITWGIVSNNTSQETHSSALGLRARTMQDDIRAALGEAKTKEIFSCAETPKPSASVSARVFPLPDAGRVAFDGGK